jgi:hypothetical protein
MFRKNTLPPSSEMNYSNPKMKAAGYPQILFTPTRINSVTSQITKKKYFPAYVYKAHKKYFAPVVYLSCSQHRVY